MSSDLTSEELDAKACEAVAIEREIFIWTRRVESCEHVKIPKADWDADPGKMREQFRAPERLEVFPPVSTDPAACAALKAAVLAKGAWPITAPSEDGGFACIVGDSDIIWQGGPYEIKIRVDFDPEGDPVMTSAHADTEERAVALAVVAWAEAQS